MNKEFKESIFTEIKKLEQEYKRMQTQKEEIQSLQSDISSRIQILLDKL